MARPRKSLNRRFWKHRVKPADLKRNCPTGKRGFAHKKEAIAMRPHEEMNAYRCEDCGEWHLGNVLTRRQRQARARSNR